MSDLQAPFEHRDALDFVKHVEKTWIPRDYKKIIVNLGDEVDQHGLSTKFVPDPNGRSNGDELEEAKHHLRDWYRAFPNTYVCVSNHTMRAWKKAQSFGLPSQFMKAVNEVYEAPVGWKWADYWVFNGIKFEHGENVSGPLAARTCAVHNRMSTVIGHQHSNGGVQWADGELNRIFGMNTGCLIDVDAYAFKYGKAMRNKPSLGCGLIINGIPFFIPMFLNAKKRWVGRTL